MRLFSLYLLSFLFLTNVAHAESSSWPIYNLFKTFVLDIDVLFLEDLELVPEKCTYTNPVTNYYIAEEGIGPCLWRAFWKEHGQDAPKGELIVIFHHKATPDKKIIAQVEWVPFASQSLQQQVFKFKKTYRFTQLDIFFTTPLALSDFPQSERFAQEQELYPEMKIRKLTLNSEYLSPDKIEEIPRAEHLSSEAQEKAWARGHLTVELKGSDKTILLDFWSNKDFIFPGGISKHIMEVHDE
ncbi:MAG: hypothetical protein A2504_02275 [Bdellovibrionales bacterium RIFOXYD12_FULL_39_22]|nr:MAG: hypothetical protein A2385_12300 [Bdellovibrionales bacterium RIFOXYB1_FULL_39_21]OFZ41422.1 MAG: hypothetical protein A2485_01470 [Bdellovibrionales bacterium RIFOXYC12_FULL_39_17]OFZ45377.1 MAG: hypothetical protein A2404_13485 [Bdellovibrionales bacterium RIFOXYC1_FULL_39_130]OFZ74573.1 MAG: hypothetical protein A2560_12590 [Bdellovibrionales bacterium RIFOXYD1_FULL_39_84]OFZ74865.1 MAG: hypothetical protein A2451_04635 [Bdellovibrionales bacterium RIFOXYC2_FULL_39_8]OFZ92582.1 MAG: